MEQRGQTWVGVAALSKAGRTVAAGSLTAMSRSSSARAALRGTAWMAQM